MFYPRSLMRAALSFALALVPLVALPAPARADGAERANLGDGYSLLVENGSVSVVKGKQRARLAEAQSILSTKIDKAKKQVDVSIGDYSCTGEATYHWTFGHLDARLENTSAYALHKKKDYKAAAPGFARAAAADPTWNIPAYNLASARQLSGDLDGAVQALAPWIAAAPIATYVKVAADPELAPLLPRNELAALRTKVRGTATLDKSGELVGLVAYSKDKGLVALTRTERGWGACVYTTELELREAATGKLVAHTPIIHWSETSPECEEKSDGVLPRARATVAKRVKTLSSLLGDLGFVKTKLEKGVLDTAGDKQLARFPKAKLGLAMSQGSVRLLAKDTVLGTGAALDRFTQAALVEEPRLAIVWSLRPGAEGCEGSDPTDVTVIPYAPVAPPAKP